MTAPKNGQPIENADTLARFENLVGNVMSARSELFRRLFDPRRDIDDECGYPRDGLSAQDYYALFDRDPIANRVVEVYPKESWQVQPEVYEDESPKSATEFEEVWDGLGRHLNQGSYYQDEAGGPIWEMLLRADILSGIGQYGAVFLGLDDGQELSQPAKQAKKLLFAHVLPESLAIITSWESDRTNPRYGQPAMYQVTLGDPYQQWTGIVASQSVTTNVHWSRIVHIADNLTSNKWLGTPRMRPVLNRLLDLRKLYGGSAEMYWKGAFPGYVLSSHPQLGGDVAADTDKMRDMMENYMNGLQRYVALMGFSMQGLAPQVVDPTSQIAVQLEAVCIKLGIPKRVFIGSERGELASGQDDAAWNDRLKLRQKYHITPRVIVPFVDRLIHLGILPTPKGYSVFWPDLASQTDQEKANVAATKTNAAAQYIAGNVEALIPPLEYLTEIFGMTDERAEAILADAAARAEE